VFPGAIVRPALEKVKFLFLFSALRYEGPVRAPKAAMRQSGKSALRLISHWTLSSPPVLSSAMPNSLDLDRRPEDTASSSPCPAVSTRQ
jgi:hypothetical protein